MFMAEAFHHTRLATKTTTKQKAALVQNISCKGAGSSVHIYHLPLFPLHNTQQLLGANEE